ARKEIASQSDVSEPFRNGVLLTGGFFALATLNDTFWFLFQGVFQSLGFTENTRTPESMSSTVVLIVFLGSTAAALLYSGLVLMVPSPVPSLESVLQEEEDAAKAYKKNRFSSLSRTWYYGLNLGQSYTISRDDGAWCFTEELAGQRYSGSLSPAGDWLQGELRDSSGSVAGTLRVRRGEGNTALSSIRPPGETEWGAQNEAMTPW
ncbi:unnamed protein product, partial [Polarella glacialis]